MCRGCEGGVQESPCAQVPLPGRSAAGSHTRLLSWVRAFLCLCWDRAQGFRQDPAPGWASSPCCGSLGSGRFWGPLA